MGRVETGDSGLRQAGTVTGAAQVGPRTGKGTHRGSHGLCGRRHRSYVCVGGGGGAEGGEYIEGVGCADHSAGRGCSESGSQMVNIGLIFPVT